MNTKASGRVQCLDELGTLDEARSHDRETTELGQM